MPGATHPLAQSHLHLYKAQVIYNSDLPVDAQLDPDYFFVPRFLANLTIVAIPVPFWHLNIQAFGMERSWTRFTAQQAATLVHKELFLLLCKFAQFFPTMLLPMVLTIVQLWAALQKQPACERAINRHSWKTQSQNELDWYPKQAQVGSLKAQCVLIEAMSHENHSCTTSQRQPRNKDANPHFYLNWRRFVTETWRHKFKSNTFEKNVSTLLLWI